MESLTENINKMDIRKTDRDLGRVERDGGKVYVAQSLYDETSDNYKGVIDGKILPCCDNPEQYIGKRFWMPPFYLFNYTCLLIEGDELEIVPDEQWTKNDAVAKKARKEFAMKKQLKENYIGGDTPFFLEAGMWVMVINNDGSICGPYRILGFSPNNKDKFCAYLDWHKMFEPVHLTSLIPAI